MAVTVSKPQGWSGTTKDRQGNKGGAWGDNGAGRPTTEASREGWEMAFGKKSNNKPKDPKDLPFRMKINGEYVN